MPDKKTTKGAKKVSVKKLKKRLVDENVVPVKKSSTDFSLNMGLAVLALLLFAAGIFLYYFFFQNQPELATDERPEIVIPENSLPQTEDGLVDEEEPAAEEPEVEVLRVLILDTPTGFLNVRTGPGTNFSKIGTVSPGETYPLVSENEEETWYEIGLEGGTGWVIKTYAELE